MGYIYFYLNVWIRVHFNVYKVYSKGYVNGTDTCIHSNGLSCAPLIETSSAAVLV